MKTTSVISKSTIQRWGLFYCGAQKLLHRDECLVKNQLYKNGQPLFSTTFHHTLAILEWMNWWGVFQSRQQQEWRVKQLQGKKNAGLVQGVGEAHTSDMSISLSVLQVAMYCTFHLFLVFFILTGFWEFIYLFLYFAFRGSKRTVAFMLLCISYSHGFKRQHHSISLLNNVTIHFSILLTVTC